jgi:hypothetical protein
MIDEEEIEILYNNCYGSWSLSSKADQLYKLRHTNYNLDYRDDPILVQIYKELGDEFDNKYSETKIWKIPKKYKNYYYISEYDGNECVKIDYAKYILDNIKEILQNNNNNDTKINQIEKVILSFEI